MTLQEATAAQARAELANARQEANLVAMASAAARCGLRAYRAVLEHEIQEAK